MDAGADPAIKDEKNIRVNQIVQKELSKEYSQLSNAMHLDQPTGDIMHNIKFLSLAIKEENPVITELKNKIFLEAAKNNYPDVVEDLLKMWANQNAQSKDGATALHFAVANGHRSIIVMLMSNGADPYN